MPKIPTEQVRQAASEYTQPDGERIQVLEVAAVARLAEKLQVSRRSVEITALEMGILPLRYARNFKAYGHKDQIALLKAQVVVFGLGGLGGAVCETLARVGVGRLTLVDGDRFSDHNLNRQALCTEAALGEAKAEAAAHRIESINRMTETAVYADFMTAANVDATIQGAQVIVDCLDNISGRFILEAAARKAGLPLVSAAVGGEAGHLMVIYPGDRGLEQIYGPPDVQHSEKGAEATLGCLPHMVTLMANLEVNETLNILLGRGSRLRGRMLLVDLASGLFETVDLQP
jgi:molybdopterin/thiamine biosynthesis adenylyltransferase